MLAEVKILLIHPPGPASTDQRPSDTHPSPGLALLATVLDRAGHGVTAMDLAHLPLEVALSEVRSAQAALRPDLVGMGFLTFNRFGAYRSVAAIREVDPQVPIVLGGRHASFQWAQLLRELPVDYVLCGEAERSLPALAVALAAGDRAGAEAIEGLARRRDGEPVRQAGHLEVEDLNSLPFPDYDLLTGAPLPAGAGSQAELGLGLMVETSRGCPGGCAFCQCPAWARGRIRRRRVERVVDQIAYHHKRQGRTFFSLADDTFGDDPDYARALAEALSARDLPIRFSASARPDAALGSDLLRKLRAAGLVSLHIGAESGAARILRAMGKRCRPDQTERLVQACRQAGVATRLLLITGYPGETAETLEQTATLVQSARPDGLNLYSPILLPGTALYRKALRAGVIDEADWMRPDPELLYLAETDREGLRAMREQVLEAFGTWPRETTRARDLLSRGLRERLADWLGSTDAPLPGLRFERLVLDEQGRLKLVLTRGHHSLVLFVEDLRGSGPAYLTTGRLAVSCQADGRHPPQVIDSAVRRLAAALERLDRV